MENHGCGPVEVDEVQVLQLRVKETQQMVELVMEYGDVFALDPAEWDRQIWLLIQLTLVKVHQSSSQLDELPLPCVAR